MYTVNTYPSSQGTDEPRLTLDYRSVRAETYLGVHQLTCENARTLALVLIVRGALI